MANKFGIVLVKPQLGENIGACAHSMKNFGFGPVPAPRVPKRHFLGFGVEFGVFGGAPEAQN